MEQLLKSCLPFWSELNDSQKQRLIDGIIELTYTKGTIIQHESDVCSGLEIIKSGRVRMFMTSPDGGEITLYRLLEGDVCVLSASCMVKSLTFDINVEYEQDSKTWMIPKALFKELGDEICAVKDFMLELVADSLSNVMWVVQQLVFSNMGKRLADTLNEHWILADGDTLTITHEAIAHDLGTAREVVSRLLKQFELEGIIELSRGTIKIVDGKRLSAM